MTIKAAPLAVAEVPIDDLRPDPANPRRISEQQLEALTKNIREHGFIQPVVARVVDKLIIAGHQRVLAARRLGYQTVPTVLLDLSLEKSRLLNVSMNQIGGTFDDELSSSNALRA